MTGGSGAQNTLDALNDTARLLWPAPAHSTIGRDAAREPATSEPRVGESATSEPTVGESATEEPDEERAVLREFLILPHPRQPRLALPTHTPAVAAEALRRYSQGLSFVERAVRSVLSACVRQPAGTQLLARMMPYRLRVTVPHGAAVDSLETHLGRILGEDVVVSIGVGPPRANRKPVLQVLTPDGTTLAFVKVGTSPSTTALVRGESEALRDYWSATSATSETPAASRLKVPRVLHHGRWRDLEILVLSPVRPSSGGRQRRTIPTGAMHELAVRLGTSRHPLAVSPAWRAARAAVGSLQDSARAAAFARIVAEAEARYGDRCVTVGTWHGDWTPWNMAWDGDRVLLWDFERFATGVPLGFDLAHYRLHTVLRARGERVAERLVRQRWDGGSDLLGGNHPTAVMVSYLVELARRYVLACDLVEGAPLHARTAWLLRLLDDLLVPR
ncbi:phosphotransferase [Actinopolymorpha alba]|uniref:phosphotransferase n=1 Tax=Actinopolymorpha alba TaxID=533267 RepID=UPI00036ACB55|nr:phosphotransferase [Actinopolymorpha alba]